MTAVGSPIRVSACNYDGSPHWEHEAWLVEVGDGIVVTRTEAGLAVKTEGGGYTSPFDTRGHYWPDRWFNVIRLEEPGKGLFGFYCNVATPAEFDGATVRYTDLQLDVRVYVDAGGLRYDVLDEDEFAAARLRFGYADELVERCRAAVDELIGLIEARAFPFDG